MRYILLLFGFVLILGCSKSNAEHVLPLTISSQPLGSFQSIAELQYDDKSQYTVGCEKPGIASSVQQVDPRIKPGMVFSYTNMLKISPSFLVSYSSSKTVLEIDSKKIVTELKIESSTLPELLNGFTAIQTCTLENGEFACKFAPLLPKAQIPDIKCELRYHTDHAPGSAKKVFLGKFVAVSGHVFLAYKTENKITVSYQCSDKEGGFGEIVNVRIVTNDLPSEASSFFCGGVTLFESDVLQKSDGSIHSGYSYEVRGWKK